jgi:flagellar protein FliS
MFATSALRNASVAYRQMGAESAVSAATSHQLIALLFDAFDESVTQARGALITGRIADKGRAIGRAVRIVEEGLKAGLDLERGGQLAQNLRQLYGYVTLRLTEANLHNDLTALEECTRLVEPLRQAWRAIDPQRPALTQ